MNSRPLLTVCIPAYNRADLLSPLLQSVLDQDFDDFSVLICEDKSPERARISLVVQEFARKRPNRIQYEENQTNLGYDGNIRQLVALAQGQYCVFMGNDDLMCPGALSSIADIVRREPQCGVVVRTYATFDQDPSVHKQVFRYYPDEVIVGPGADAIATGYRRSVVIPGMVIHRDSALTVATDQFDGTLLYQLYLVGMILAHRSVVFTPQIIALRRDGTPPDFGNSAAEKDKFVPKDQTPESSLHFMQGMLQIALHIQDKTGLRVFERIRADIGSYSYPILSIQAKRPIGAFVRYGLKLGGMGLWRYPLFHAYFILLLILGPDHVDGLIKFVKRKLGYTPRLGAARDVAS